MAHYQRIARTMIAASVAVSGFTSLAAAEPFVYVPMGSNNNITVIDAANDKVVDQINDLPAIHGLAITPDGKFLVAGSYDERPVGTLPIKPDSVSSEDHKAHHTNKAKSADSQSANMISTVSIIRRSDKTIAGAIDVAGAVHHVSVSANGLTAAVTRPNKDAISVIDLEKSAVIANTKTGSLPNYTSFSEDGKSIYVSNAGDGTVAILSGPDWKKQASIKVGDSPEHLVTSKNGKLLYVNNVNDGTVSEIDLVAKAVKRTFTIGSTLHGIDLSNDGKFLFVTDLGNDRIVKVNIADGTNENIKLSPEPYHLAAIPGTDKIYITSAAEPIIWVFNSDIGTVGLKIDIGGKGHQITTSPAM